MSRRRSLRPRRIPAPRSRPRPSRPRPGCRTTRSRRPLACRFRSRPSSPTATRPQIVPEGPLDHARQEALERPDRVSGSEWTMVTMPCMATRERSVDRGNRLARRALLTLGEEVREARFAAGLSQARVASASATSHATIGRIERGEQSGASLALLSRVCAAVGLDLSVRAYPGGDPTRDSGHVRLLARFRARLGPALTWRTEVLLPGFRDPRSWDAVISDRRTVVGVEAETRLRDLQALQRRIATKSRDGGVARVILVVADTAANRRVLAAGREYLRGSLPLDAREMLARLGSSELPGAGGVIVL